MKEINSHAIQTRDDICGLQLPARMCIKADGHEAEHLVHCTHVRLCTCTCMCACVPMYTVHVHVCVNSSLAISIYSYVRQHVAVSL